MHDLRVGDRLLTGLAAVIVVAGCATSSSSTPLPASPTATTMPSPTATTMPSPTASLQPAAVSEFRGMLPVVFTQSLVTEGSDESTETVGDVVQIRNLEWTYRNESSDPRLAGTYDGVINVDQRQSDMSARLWGTAVLSNQGGTWVGDWTGGIASGGNVHHLYLTARGTGGYAGLVVHSSGWFVEAGEGFTPDIQIVNAGWIESTDGSPVPPAPGPGTTPANWTPVVGIATTKDTAYDGTGRWLWDLDQSDPRINGVVEGAVEEIGSARSDGSIDYLASNTITNQDGSWDTPSGPIAVRGPAPVFEHFMYSTSTGSGAYEGLTYHSFWYFPEPTNMQVGDEFVWSGWIEEAR
jgi:hypothetical protein